MKFWYVEVEQLVGWLCLRAFGCIQYNSSVLILVFFCVQKLRDKINDITSENEKLNGRYESRVLPSSRMCNRCPVEIQPQALFSTSNSAGKEIDLKEDIGILMANIRSQGQIQSQKAQHVSHYMLLLKYMTIKSWLQGWRTFRDVRTLMSENTEFLQKLKRFHAIFADDRHPYMDAEVGFFLVLSIKPE